MHDGREQDRKSRNKKGGEEKNRTENENVKLE